MSNLPGEQAILKRARSAILAELDRNGVVILPPCDVEKTLTLLRALGIRGQATVLDPWYNKGVGGVRSDYIPYIVGILERTVHVTEHLFLWGFPEIVAPFIERIPKPLELVCWVTWYFKNNPSVIRGWRSAQMTCLHLSHPKALLNVESFLNEAQLQKQKEGTLRYIPGPPSVIEESLLVGFVGRNEQTGHPAQKPIRVIEKLLLMGSHERDLVIDPMSGSGTTAEAARRLGRLAIICDHSEEFTQIAEKRLCVSRIDLAPEVMSMEPNSNLEPVGDLRSLTKHAFNNTSSADSHRNISKNSHQQQSDLLLDAPLPPNSKVVGVTGGNGSTGLSYPKTKRRRPKPKLVK